MRPPILSGGVSGGGGGAGRDVPPTKFFKTGGGEWAGQHLNF